MNVYLAPDPALHVLQRMRTHARDLFDKRCNLKYKIALSNSTRANVGKTGHPQTADRDAHMPSESPPATTLKQIARELGCGPTAITHWRRDDPAFGEMYDQARMDQADYFAEEILEIADNGTNEWLPTARSSRCRITRTSTGRDCGSTRANGRWRR